MTLLNVRNRSNRRPLCLAEARTLAARFVSVLAALACVFTLAMPTVAYAAGEATPAVQSPHANILTAVVGRRVELLLVGGFTMVGEVLSVNTEPTPGAVILAREPDGRIAEVPLDQVESVRVVDALAPASQAPVVAPADPYLVDPDLNEPLMENRSTPLMIAGIVVTGLGITSVLASMPAMVDRAFTYCDDYDYDYDYWDDGCNRDTTGPALLGAGLAMVGGGVVMWIVGGSDVLVTPKVSYDAERRVGQGSLRFTF